MPRTLDAGFSTHIQGRATTVATCWKLTLTNGTVMGFTSHVEDIVLGGVTYVAKTGYTPTAIASNANLSVDNLDLEGIVASEGINKEDIRAGVYDYADVLVFEVNYEQDPPAQGRILRRGNIGELTLKDGLYVTEVRGLAQKLSRNFVRVTMPECDAEVYDARCKIASTNFQNTGSIQSIVTARRIYSIIIADPQRVSGYFAGGKILFTSGEANGRTLDIKFNASPNIELFLSSPWNIQVGDTFEIFRGCDRSFETCKTIFDNLVNFRGFHKMPGNHHLQKSGKKTSHAGGGGASSGGGKF